jgi:hypothetical protein
MFSKQYAQRLQSVLFQKIFRVTTNVSYTVVACDLRTAHPLYLNCQIQSWLKFTGCAVSNLVTKMSFVSKGEIEIMTLLIIICLFIDVFYSIKSRCY